MDQRVKELKGERNFCSFFYALKVRLNQGESKRKELITLFNVFCSLCQTLQFIAWYRSIFYFTEKFSLVILLHQDVPWTPVLHPNLLGTFCKFTLSKCFGLRRWNPLPAPPPK